MKKAACTVFLVLGWLALAPHGGVLELDNPKLTDRDRLQGLWVLRTVEWQGTREDQDSTLAMRLDSLNLTAEERSLEPDPRDYFFTLTIKGNTFCYRNNRWSTVEGTFRVGERANPRELAFRENEKTWRAIFSLEGRTLRICRIMEEEGLGPPASFRTRPGETSVVMIYSRDFPPGIKLPVSSHDVGRFPPKYLE